eukprot:s1810_g1.t1
MMRAAGCADETLVDDICRGFSLSGWLPASGEFLPWSRRPKFSVQTLSVLAKGFNKVTLQKLSRRQEETLESATWAETQKEIDDGWVWVDNEPLAENLAVAMRFGIMQNKFECFENLIQSDAWHPGAYETLHRIAWSGVLGTAIFLFPGRTLSEQSHRQLQALLRAAHLQGCHVYFEYPSNCSHEVEATYIQLCQELATHCIQAQLSSAAETVIICSNDHMVSTIAPQGDCLGTLSSIAAKHCTSFLNAPISADALGKHLPSCKDEPPLSEEHGIALASIIHSTLAPCTDKEKLLRISQGQPFRLAVLQCLAQTTQDKDAQLPIILDEGVPTGAFGPLPSSGQWPPAQEALDFFEDFSPASLEHCRGNWLAPENSPALLSQLVQEEVAKVL